MTSWNKILCIPVALMILMAVITVPTMACSPYAPCSNSTPATVSTDSSLLKSVLFEQLIGNDAKIALEKANTDADLDKLKNKLANDGYSIDLDKATTTKMTLSNETASICIDYTSIPMSNGKDGISANIAYMDMGNGQTVSFAQFSGSGKDFPQLIKMLKSNYSYASAKSELEKDGYIVDESSAKVVEIKLGSDDLAVVTMDVQNGTSSKTITALIDGNTGVIALGLDLCTACLLLAGAAVGTTTYILCIGPALAAAMMCGPALVVMCQGLAMTACGCTALITGAISAYDFCHNVVGWCQ